MMGTITLTVYTRHARMIPFMPRISEIVASKLGITTLVALPHALDDGTIFPYNAVRVWEPSPGKTAPDKARLLLTLMMGRATSSGHEEFILEDDAYILPPQEYPYPWGLNTSGWSEIGIGGARGPVRLRLSHPDEWGPFVRDSYFEPFSRSIATVLTKYGPSADGGNVNIAAEQTSISLITEDDVHDFFNQLERSLVERMLPEEFFPLFITNKKSGISAINPDAIAMMGGRWFDVEFDY